MSEVAVHRHTMTDIEQAIEAGRRTVRIEARAVAALEQRIDGEFASAVELLACCTGRVIITGVGKSGIIARKIVATADARLVVVGHDMRFGHRNSGEQPKSKQCQHHVANQPQETYKITCASKPEMKSLILELAQ